MVAVIELGFTNVITAIQTNYLEEVQKGLGVTIHAVVERAKTEKLSVEFNNRIKAINRSNATIEFDLEGNIITANHLFLELMEYSLEEIQGKHHAIFVDPEYAKTADFKNFWKELGKGAFKADKFTRYTKTGKKSLHTG